MFTFVTWYSRRSDKCDASVWLPRAFGRDEPSRLLKKSSQPASPSVVSPASGVGVGIMVTHDPLHGSGRAALPHPALASGNDANAAQRMTLCCQPYPLQRTGRTLPALSPRRVLLGRFPLASPLPSISSAAGCPTLF